MPRAKQKPTRLVHNDTGELAKTTCFRLGCSHLHEKHEDGRCKGLNYDPFGPATPCECTGFVEGPAPKPPANTAPEVVMMQLRWHGKPPKQGEWLRGQGVRTQFAYRIASAFLMGTAGAARPNTPVFEIAAYKFPLNQIPEGVVVHPLSWDKVTGKPKSTRHYIRYGVGWGDEE